MNNNNNSYNVNISFNTSMSHNHHHPKIAKRSPLFDKFSISRISSAGHPASHQTRYQTLLKKDGTNKIPPRTSEGREGGVLDMDNDNPRIGGRGQQQLGQTEFRPKCHTTSLIDCSTSAGYSVHQQQLRRVGAPRRTVLCYSLNSTNDNITNPLPHDGQNSTTSENGGCLKSSYFSSLTQAINGIASEQPPDIIENVMPLQSMPQTARPHLDATFRFSGKEKFSLCLRKVGKGNSNGSGNGCGSGNEDVDKLTDRVSHQRVLRYRQSLSSQATERSNHNDALQKIAPQMNAIHDNILADITHPSYNNLCDQKETGKPRSVSLRYVQLLSQEKLASAAVTYCQTSQRITSLNESPAHKQLLQEKKLFSNKEVFHSTDKAITKTSCSSFTTSSLKSHTVALNSVASAWTSYRNRRASNGSILPSLQKGEEKGQQINNGKVEANRRQLMRYSLVKGEFEQEWSEVNFKKIEQANDIKVQGHLQQFPCQLWR